MPTRGRDPDVLIIGGGPAGCAAARLLALWGHQVSLVTKPLDSGVASGGPEVPPPMALSQSLSPSAGKLWSVLGVESAIERAGFVRSTGNTVWWGSDSRIEPFAEGSRGWQVTDAALAPVLQAAAADVGVRIEHRTLMPGEAAAMPAAFRLDCSGRTGVLARSRGERRYEPDLRTVALAGRWLPADAWDVPDTSHTLIESYADGWAWSVPLADGGRSVAVMVDPRTTDLVKGQGGRDTYLAELAKTRRFAALLRGARLHGKVAGWDASMYSSAHYAGDDWLLVGDAGSFVDPLSSAGVAKALASGWLAAIVVHTCLRRPAMAAIARAFFQTREAEVYEGLRRQTRSLLAQGATGAGHPFWEARLVAAASDAQFLSGTRTGDEAAVRAAWEQLRHAPAIALRRGDRMRVELRPAVGGTQIVLERRVVTGDTDPGVRFLHDVDIVGLIDLAPGHRQVPDLFEAYIQHTGPISLADFLTALATAVSREWLVPA